MRALERDTAVEVDTVAGRLLLPRGDGVITPALQSGRVWEVGETRFLLSTLRSGHVFVDVGAHVGYFSVLAARRVAPTGTVIAIEPEARNLELLRLNVARHKCGNVVVLPYAAAASAGWMSLALDEENRGGHRLVPLGEAETHIRCLRLDDVLPKRVNVVKIDAQGYDHEVIEGLRSCLAANPDLIVIVELSLSELGRRGIDPASVLARYRELGLAASTLDELGRLRRMSVAEIVAGCRAGRFPADFSLVLECAPGDGVARPERIAPAD